MAFEDDIYQNSFLGFRPNRLREFRDLEDAGIDVFAPTSQDMNAINIANTANTTPAPNYDAAQGLFSTYATNFAPDQAALDFWSNKINTLGYDAALNEFLNPAQGKTAPRFSIMSQDPDYLAATGQITGGLPGVDTTKVADTLTVADTATTGALPGTDKVVDTVTAADTLTTGALPGADTVTAAAQDIITGATTGAETKADTAGALTAATTGADMSQQGVLPGGTQTTATTTAKTTDPKDLVYDYQGKSYDKNQLLKLAAQIGPNITSLAGGVFSTSGQSVGFDFDEATKILGEAPTVGQQVVLDMARNLLNMGVTDLSQLNIKEQKEDLEVFEILDDQGRPTGTYGTSVRDPNNPEGTMTRILTPEEVARIRTESSQGSEGDNVRKIAEDILTGRTLYSGDQLINASNQVTEGLSFDIGVTYTGPDSTRYRLIMNPTTGKPEFAAYYSSTSDMDKVGAILTMASFVPQLAVFAKAIQAGIAIKSGDVLGGLANLAGIGGFDNVSTALKVANAAKNGDAVQLVSAVLSNSDISKAAGDIKLVGDTTLKDVGNGIKLADALANQNWSAALTIAGTMSNSSDLVTAGAATKVITAVQSGNPILIADAVMNLDKVTSAANKVTDQNVASNIADTVKNTQVASLNTSVTGTATDAVGDMLDTTVGGGGNDLTVKADDVSAEDTFTGLDQLAVDTFVDAKNKGATDEEALNAANSVLTTSKTTVDEFGGFGDATKATADRSVLNISNTEANTPEEAAALASSKGFSHFTFGGTTYALSASTQEINRQVTNQEIASQSNFNDAYRIAREKLGAGQTFEWGGKTFTTDTREENPAVAAASDALRASLAKPVDTPENLDKAVKSVETTTTYGGPKILGIPVGTPQDAINTVKRMGEVVTDFSRGIGQGFGNFLNSVGTLGHIVAASIQGGDTKNAVIARDNVLSTMGKNLAGYYEGMTTEQSQQEWKNIVQAVDAAPEYLKPIVAVTATLQNFGGFVNKVGGEVGEEIAPILTGVGVGAKALQLGASGTAKTIAVTATLGDMAESAQGSYDTVMKRVENNPNMTDAEKHWAGTQAAATSMVATAVFGYGANSYLAKSLVGDMVGSTAQKALGPMAVEYITEFPETVIQSLGEKFAEKGSIDAKDVTDANTDASISALIGSKTAGTLTGSVQVVGMVSNGFVGAGDGKGGVAIVQDDQGRTALVPASNLTQGQTFDISEVQQLQNAADVVSQFDFSPEDASRITESVQGLVDTKAERDAKSADEAASFDPSTIDFGAALQTTQTATATPGGVSIGTGTTTGTTADTTKSADTTTDTKTGATTTTSTDATTGATTQTTADPTTNTTTTTQSNPNSNTTTQTTVNNNSNTTTETTVNNNTGVNTQVTTDANNNTNTTTTTDTNTNTTTQVTTNTQTNTTTETTVNNNTNTTTQTTTDTNNNTQTTTQINNNTNVVTQTTTDSNSNTETSIVTDPTTNTQVTTVIDTTTGEVIDTKTTEIPEDWKGPVIDTPDPVTIPPTETKDTKTTSTPTSKTPSTPTRRQASPFLMPGLLAAPEIYPDDRAKFKDPFISSAAEQRKFVGSLDPFFQEVESGDMLHPEFMAETPSVPLQDQEETKEEKMPNYFTYGMQTDLDSLFGPFGATGTGLSEFEEEEPMAAKRGGLATPLMAGGGLTRYGRYAGGGVPLVAHSGKARVDFRQGDAVTGPGDGQSDDIPAMLADGEFVIPADVVAALGNGSTKAGSDKLYDMMHSIRAYHRSAKPKDLPPSAKANPLDYLKKTSRKARR